MFTWIRSILFITIICLGTPMHSMDEFDLNAFEHELDNIPEEILEQTKHTCILKPFTDDQLENCIEVLTDIVNTIPILEIPLYLRTHPLHKRNVLDLPLFALWYTCPTSDSAIRLDGFYNQTSRGNFTAGSTNIRDYIALEDENLIRALEDAEQQIKEDFPDFDLEIPLILPLFSCMTTQERRGGLIVQYLKNIGCLQMVWKLPFFYVERNFFLTDCEIDAIRAALIPGLSARQDTPESTPTPS